jgi:para-aminobenzoate synthetase component 1
MDADLFKEKAIRWADQFDYCCVLDSNGYADPYGRYDLLIAAGAQHICCSGFKDLKAFYERHRNWVFGYLGYDLKNQIENLSSNNPDGLSFPESFFFVPEYVMAINANGPEVLLGNSDILAKIEAFQGSNSIEASSDLSVRAALSKDAYIKKVGHIQEHIARGDIYELTFCQEFFAEHAHIDPLQTFRQLNAISPMPFAGYLKLGGKYILSASPERFLCKRGNRLISQPIKGTAARHSDPEKDQKIRHKLREDLKEQTENVMIVDLVRNDLTKSAVPGSVQVTELFGISTFPKVHQMISTIACQLDPAVHFMDAIKQAFPMGSMTGAPKIRAMELIERYESSKRGAYSGAMGYFSPQGDFDLNVIIRSLMYNAENQYLSYQVGGAITYAADAEKEYEECLLKASGILETIKGPR